MASIKEDFQASVKRYRNMPLIFILEAIGAVRDKDDPVRWRYGETSVWLERKAVKPYKFHNWATRQEYKGAIDLIIYIYGYEFSKAIKLLQDIDQGNNTLDNLKMKGV